MKNLRELLSVADQYKFGIPACNCRSKFIINAVLEAAFLEKAPVILEIAESEISYCNMEPKRLSMLANESFARLQEKYGYSVPVCLHHDHIQKDVTGCVDNAIAAGFNSVEVDLSKLPLEENAAQCKQVIDKIRPLGLSLEVEDGEIGTTEALADPEVEKNIENYYSKVPDCVKLCEIVRPDALAFFVGNGHGNYLKAPIIGYQRIKEICNAVRPLGVYGVMHGGTGLTPENFRNCVASGARKFNYATALSDIWFKYFPEDLLARMDAKGKELNRPRRKVLNLFESEWDKIDFTEAEAAIVSHMRMMMKDAFSCSGRSELYK